MKSVYFLSLFVLFTFWVSLISEAQDNYEIQVYASDLVDQNNTMVELHSNYTINGTKPGPYNMFASNHLVHETLEFTRGFSKWFEIGGYLFTSIGSDGRTGFAGTHIRPRFAIPEQYNLPVGISLSTEFGYQRFPFFDRHWLAELRPIFDKKINKFYFAINLTVDLSLDKNQSDGLQFNPCFKSSFQVSPKVDLGVEYYGGLGAFKQFDPIQNQKHSIFGALDWNFNPEWEFNTGIGYGLTSGTDRWIVKFILGRRFAI